MFGRTKDAAKNKEAAERAEDGFGHGGREERFDPLMDERAMPLQPLANDEHETKGFNPKVARPAQEPRAPKLPTGAAPDARRRSDEDKTLTVGRDITLHGEIADCQKVHVEGNVEATLTSCRSLVITESGAFSGSAEVDTAEISGRFEGKLVCAGRLFVRASGSVSGEIAYGRIEIELGGELHGKVATVAASERSSGETTIGLSLGKSLSAG